MFDTKSIVFIDNLEFWFCRCGLTNSFSVYYNKPDSEKPIAVYNESEDKLDLNAEAGPFEDDIESKIRSAFYIFKDGRPEYEVGRFIDSKLLADNADPKCIDARCYLFDKILAGAICMHIEHSKVPSSANDSGVTYAARCINWLRSTDFYNSPASTRFHEAIPNGLLLHTLKVLNQVYQLMSLPAFSSVKLHEAAIVALAHDWCKIGTYESYMKNVKDESTGVWNKVPAYKHKDTSIPFGHGVSSMYIAQRFVYMNMQQALAIRWHMGRWYVSDSEMNDLQNANENYPLVHLLQFADQLAITNYAN